jgi:amphi-Trp domain-containing protein
MGDRDITATYSVGEFAAKLRRLADALESGGPFRIQIAGERFTVPRTAAFNVEHERGDGEEEIEFQLRWSTADAEAASSDDGDDV